MSVQEFPAKSSVKDVVTQVGQGSFRQELMVKLNHESVKGRYCETNSKDTRGANLKLRFTIFMGKFNVMTDEEETS